MTAKTAYLDWNASAPLLPAARNAVESALEVSANPSSVHQRGRAARRIVETARRQVAALVNSKPDRVIFTSGATEAAQLALSPNYVLGRSPVVYSRLYVCSADHPCTLGGGRFAKESVKTFGVHGNGVVDLVELAEVLAGHDKSNGLPLVCIHWVNNETGVIQPVEKISAMVRDAGGTLIVDAVQAAGRIPIDLSTDIADFVILSGHKIGAPSGAGALVASGDILLPSPLIGGGGQEKGHRGGTENLTGIAGFGAAAEAALAALAGVASIEQKRDRMESAIGEILPDAIFYGQETDRVANTTCFSVPNAKAETLQIAFDLAGVAVSAGSACSSGRTGPSHVMKAMGAEAESAIRVSIGASTSDEEIDLFINALREIASRRKSAVKAA